MFYQGRINVIRQVLASLLVAFPRPFECDIRVGAESKRFSLAAKPIIHAPVFATRGLNQKIQAAPVRELVLFAFS